ncbi:MAG: DJ-1 family glyoxalase III [Phocaeicola sp.]
MKTVYLFLAEGFEEIEAISPIDILRRAGVNVKSVSIMPSKEVHGAHGITILADYLFEEIDAEAADMLVLPGGLPGATNLDTHAGLGELILTYAQAGKPLAAICAAPLVFGKRGLLKGKKATCYPGFENYLEEATYTASLVEKDGLFITGKGPGASFAFAFAIVELLCGIDTVNQLKAGMMMPA